MATHGGQSSCSIESATQFPIGDIDDALDAYHSTLAARERIGAATDTVLRYVAAVRHGDREHLEAVLTASARLVDHRPLGYGRLDRAGIIEMVLTPATGDDRGLMIPTALVRDAGVAAVLSFTRIFVGDRGEHWEAAGGLVTALVHDGRAVRYDLYAEDDLDAALAQAARLEPAVAETDRPERTSGWFYDGTIDPVWLAGRSDVEVESVGLMLRFVDAVAVADADALDALLHPGFSTGDHRPVGWGPRSRETFLEAVRQRPTTLGTGIAHGEILLELGPVGLCRYELTTTTTDSGGEISEAGLGLVVADEGRVRWMELFGEADHAAAVVRTRELAELHRPTN